MAPLGDRDGPGRRVRAGTVLQVTHIAGLARLVRLAAADGDQNAVSVASVVELREVGGLGRVIELPAVEPGVELAEGAG